MSGAGGGGAQEVRRRLIERSAQDERFRERLLADPKAAVEEEMGARLPEGIEIHALEETPDTIYLVLPPKAVATQGGGELSDRELEAVAGGWENAGTEMGRTCSYGSGCFR